MYPEQDQRIVELEKQLREAEADLSSLLSESPMWISLDGFNLVSDREQAWKRLAIEAQAWLAPTNPTWQAIEDLRRGIVRNDKQT